MDIEIANPFKPSAWCQMVRHTLQSVQGHTSLTYFFIFFDIQALWRLGLSARVPECQKIKKGGLDQYGAERVGRLIFATIRKSVGLKELIGSVSIYIPWWLPLQFRGQS